MTLHTLAWLQQWYRSQCDGEWEHDKGVRIDTLDNPGWSVKVDIGMIPDPEPIVVDRNENDWVKCKVKDAHFYGYGGPGNLEDILEVLRAWITVPAAPAQDIVNAENAESNQDAQGEPQQPAPPSEGKSPPAE